MKLQNQQHKGGILKMIAKNVLKSKSWLNSILSFLILSLLLFGSLGLTTSCQDQTGSQQQQEEMTEPGEQQEAPYGGGQQGDQGSEGNEGEESW